MEKDYKTKTLKTTEKKASPPLETKKVNKDKKIKDHASYMGLSFEAAESDLKKQGKL